MSFILPLKNGKIIKTKKDTLVIEGQYYDKVISPEDGVIYETKTDECDGMIKIEHSSGSKKIYSKICKCGSIETSVGNSVRQGEKIGKIQGNIVELTFEDSFSSSLPPYSLLALGLDDNKKEKDKEEQKGLGEPEKEKKKEKEKEKTDDGLDYDKKRREYDPSKKIPNPFLDALLLPFQFTSAALSSKNKKLNEEIERIKNLIK
jgi:hypothetical protein